MKIVVLHVRRHESPDKVMALGVEAGDWDTDTEVKSKDLTEKLAVEVSRKKDSSLSPNVGVLQPSL